MLTRRQFIVGTAALANWRTMPSGQTVDTAGELVNDIHSQLNPTKVDRIARPGSRDELQQIVRRARAGSSAVSICGGRHAMGGQQFGSGAVLIDMTGMQRVLGFDATKGLVEVEGGIEWPGLVDHLLRVQRGQARSWGIIQKQTGADRLSIGGALAANVHGRGLKLKPFINDVESFTLVDGAGDVRVCSRSENAELFRLAIGGYGLFGVIASVNLRLEPRRKVQRIVEIIDAHDLAAAFDKRIAEGFVFGDFQYATDEASDDFMRRGVFSCYRPVDDGTPLPEGQKELSTEDWDKLFYLSHADKKRAFDAYSSYYLTTSGQVYWSDTHQLSVYLDNYHVSLDQRLGGEKGTEMITEIYVPRDALGRFLEDVRQEFRRPDAGVIYGTIRLIERDEESFLAWARQPWACIIFNLHVVHNPKGIERAGESFRQLIDLGMRYGGSYYLTYHRWAMRQQVEACYPQFREFLRLKRNYDPGERFQSDWYRHYRKMFGN